MDDLSLKDLGKHPFIEEQYRLKNKANDDTSKVHVVEEKGKSSKAGGKKRRHDDKDKRKSKKNKKDVICYNCRKPGHFKRECRALKKKQDGGNDNKNKNNNFVAMMSEAFSLEEEKSWWVDLGANRHVCNDQTMFKTYERSYSMLYMGNHSTAQVKGKGKIDLVFTASNTLTLNDVLRVPDVRKNLVSISLLNKFGFKLVFESDKFILFKSGKFVGKGYHTGGMFKLNIKDVVNSSVNDVNMTEINDANDASAVNTIIESRDARFDKNRFKTIPKSHEISKEIVSTEIPITAEGNNNDSIMDHQQVEPRRSTRQRRQRSFGPDFEMYLVEGDRKGLVREYPIIYNLDEDPQTYSKAMKSHDSLFWKESVNDEMDSVIGNYTWILVELPPGSKAIKSKWIFKRKLRVDGSIEKFKARTDLEQVQMAKKILSENFDMKDLGEADVILGIKILQKEKIMMLTQSNYIEKILKRFDSFDCLPVSTPFEVGRLSRHTSSPGKEHWDDVNRVFKYIKKTMDYGLEYSEDPSVLKGYTDASWITDQEDYASTSGWIFTLVGCSVLGIKETELFNRLYYGSRVCGIGVMLQRSRIATRLVNKHTLMAETYDINLYAL
nr:zinc finger, CCHC-type [Tanacetum cinerariifolium]